MVATAPVASSSLAGRPALGRSASRIASDRRGVTQVSPENAAFEALAPRRPGRAGAPCIGRTRPHRRDSHRGRRRFSSQTRIGRYSWARYYHPGLQRFISEDPVGLAAGDLNFYVYVANDPLDFVDPLGLDKNQCPSGGDSLVTAANFSAGFGDIITSGLGLTYAVGLPSGTEAVRSLWMETPGLPTSGAPDVVNPKCSWAYTTGQVAGVADAIAIIGIGAVRGVQPGGVLNTGRYFRVGFGRHGGERVFRIAGRWVERITGRAHIDLWRGGPL